MGVRLKHIPGQTHRKVRMISKEISMRKKVIPIKTTPRAKKVPDWKKKQVDEIKKLTTTYSTIAIINLEMLPNKQLQLAKKKLRGKILVKPAKKLLIIKAFESSANPKVKELVSHLGREPALIFTNLSAFELFKLLKDSRQSVPAKPNQIAPDDIWVSAGPTPFTPGPVISEFAQLKIKAGVVSGKIEIKQNSLVVKKGEKVIPLAASILAKLGITPVKIGVNLVAAVEKGDLYLANVLDIDTDKFIADLKQAARDALALSMELGIINSDNAPQLIAKAERDAQAVSAKIIGGNTL